MAQKIILKNSSVASRVPNPADLDLGELAVNTTDGKLFTKKGDGTVVDITGGSSSSSISGTSSVLPTLRLDLPNGTQSNPDLGIGGYRAYSENTANYTNVVGEYTNWVQVYYNTTLQHIHLRSDFATTIGQLENDLYFDYDLVYTDSTWTYQIIRYTNSANSRYDHYIVKFRIYDTNLTLVGSFTTGAYDQFNEIRHTSTGNVLVYGYDGAMEIDITTGTIITPLAPLPTANRVSKYISEDLLHGVDGFQYVIKTDGFPYFAVTSWYDIDANTVYDIRSDTGSIAYSDVTKTDYNYYTFKSMNGEFALMLKHDTAPYRLYDTGYRFSDNNIKTWISSWDNSIVPNYFNK